jgi:small subunit ribosomal protein S1
MNQSSSNNIDNHNQTGLSMEELLAQYSMPTKLEVGRMVQGTVFAKDEKLGLWIDFGGKTEALVPNDEIGTADLPKGTKTTFLVLDTPEDGEGIPTFSAKRAQGWIEMASAKTDARTIVVHTYREPAKNGTGGIAGIKASGNGVTGFIPYSLSGAKGRSIEALLNVDIEVKVVDVDANNRKLIFDHAVVVEEKAKAQAAAREAQFDALKAEVDGGKVVVLDGKVTSLAKKTQPGKTPLVFGCFVDVGEGLHGLVHRSELSGDSKTPVSELVKIGDTLKVAVIKAERTPDGKRQLSLSVKACKQAEFLSTLSEGAIVSGTVARMVAYGCFVELSTEYGVDGLLHLSQYSSAVRNGRKALKPGDKVRVKVLKTDARTGQVKLSMREVPQERPQAAQPADVTTVPAPAATTPVEVK